MKLNELTISQALSGLESKKFSCRELVQDCFAKIKKQIPNVVLTTDIIVGFPGETKKQFQNTVKLAKEIKFEKAYIAKYSPRQGTLAFKLKNNVSPQEKKTRWQILEKLINK